MSVKAIFVIVDLDETALGVARANCIVKILDGSGTGTRFAQEFGFDPNAANVNTQIHAAVRQHLLTNYSGSFTSGDTLLLLPAIL